MKKYKKLLNSFVCVCLIIILTGCTPAWRAQMRLNAAARENEYIQLREEQLGRAAMLRAEYEAQIMEIEARSRLQAEILNAQAEIERARGVAQAMYIIREAITPEYLHHFWIRTLENHNGVIYVATEGNFPILPQLDINDILNSPIN
ncbi:MAG: hypothetical protein FWF57_05940 [Defluviitaleaceae bacterium]|nr:hypothetical protein [Defluviitaleaceae bacterium]